MPRFGLLSFVLVFLLDGCASLYNEPPAVVYQLDMPESDRVRFSGRGSGAGIMLSGSMGAMGIAIGVAIDEGIAKDIQKTAQAANLDFSDLFKETIEANSDSPVQWLNDDSVESPGRIYVIKEYGFVTVPGDSDAIYPMLKLSVEQEGDIRELEIPDDFLEQPDLLPKTTFSQIKTEAAEIERLWRDALALVAATE